MTTQTRIDAVTGRRDTLPADIVGRTFTRDGVTFRIMREAPGMRDVFEARGPRGDVVVSRAELTAYAAEAAERSAARLEAHRAELERIDARARQLAIAQGWTGAELREALADRQGRFYRSGWPSWRRRAIRALLAEGVTFSALTLDVLQ